MKKVLVIYYTQSGQLKRAVDATLKNFNDSNQIQVHYERLELKTEFSFPWTHSSFFNEFAPTVNADPLDLKPLSPSVFHEYDLIVLAYQPWFLSISRPMASFLESKDASAILKNKPVLNIIACRNMWVNAQEKMVEALKRTGASPVGNIAFCDRAPNLVSLITVLAFAFWGVQKKLWRVFPPYGVSVEELDRVAWRYGDIVREHLLSDHYKGLQSKLVAAGAVKIKPSLLIMEERGKVLFPIYADFINKGGKKGSKRRAKAFGIILPILILVLSPIITIASALIPIFSKKKLMDKIRYHQGLEPTVGQ